MCLGIPSPAAKTGEGTGRPLFSVPGSRSEGLKPAGQTRCGWNRGGRAGPPSEDVLEETSGVRDGAQGRLWPLDFTRTEQKAKGGDSPTPVSPPSGPAVPRTPTPRSPHSVSPPGPPSPLFGVPVPSSGRALSSSFPRVCLTSSGIPQVPAALVQVPSAPARPPPASPYAQRTRPPARRVGCRPGRADPRAPQRCRGF